MLPTTSCIVLLERQRSLLSHVSVQLKSRSSGYLPLYCQAIHLIVKIRYYYLWQKKNLPISVLFGIVDFLLKISILAETSVLTQLSKLTWVQKRFCSYNLFGWERKGKGSTGVIHAIHTFAYKSCISIRKFAARSCRPFI